MVKKPSKIIKACKETKAAIDRVKADRPAITLNREQIAKLNEIVNHFKEINKFTVQADTSSGIGVGIQVTFDLFEKEDTTVDITDVKDW